MATIADTSSRPAVVTLRSAAVSIVIENRSKEGDYTYPEPGSLALYDVKITIDDKPYKAQLPPWGSVSNDEKIFVVWDWIKKEGKKSRLYLFVRRVNGQWIPDQRVVELPGW